MFSFDTKKNKAISIFRLRSLCVWMTGYHGYRCCCCFCSLACLASFGFWVFFLLHSRLIKQQHKNQISLSFLVENIVCSCGFNQPKLHDTEIYENWPPKHKQLPGEKRKDKEKEIINSFRTYWSPVSWN